jgi:hypothetical protein
MVYIFRITDIEMPKLEVLAEESDHAAELFIHALMEGLFVHPNCAFATLEWTEHRRKRHPTVDRWAKEGKSGIPWHLDSGTSWELVRYDPHVK